MDATFAEQIKEQSSQYKSCRGIPQLLFCLVLLEDPGFKSCFLNAMRKRDVYFKEMEPLRGKQYFKHSICHISVDRETVCSSLMQRCY